MPFDFTSLNDKPSKWVQSLQELERFSGASGEGKFLHLSCWKATGQGMLIKCDGWDYIVAKIQGLFSTLFQGVNPTSAECVEYEFALILERENSVLPKNKEVIYNIATRAGILQKNTLSSADTPRMIDIVIESLSHPKDDLMRKDAQHALCTFYQKHQKQLEKLFGQYQMIANTNLVAADTLSLPSAVSQGEKKCHLEEGVKDGEENADLNDRSFIYLQGPAKELHTFPSSIQTQGMRPASFLYALSKTIKTCAIGLLAASAIYTLYRARLHASQEADFSLLKGAANQGDANAMNTLGDYYWKGIGVGQNLEEACKWYKEAVLHNHTQAIFNLEECYQDQIGMVRYDQDDAHAMRALGDYYSKGIGVTKDPEKAYKWYREAAFHTKQPATSENLDSKRGKTPPSSKQVEMPIKPANQKPKAENIGDTFSKEKPEMAKEFLEYVQFIELLDPKKPEQAVKILLGNDDPFDHSTENFERKIRQLFRQRSLLVHSDKCSKEVCRQVFVKLEGAMATIEQSYITPNKDLDTIKNLDIKEATDEEIESFFPLLFYQGDVVNYVTSENSNDVEETSKNLKMLCTPQLAVMIERYGLRNIERFLSLEQIKNAFSQIDLSNVEQLSTIFPMMSDKRREALACLLDEQVAYIMQNCPKCFTLKDLPQESKHRKTFVQSLDIKTIPEITLVSLEQSDLQAFTPQQVTDLFKVTSEKQPLREKKLASKLSDDQIKEYIKTVDIVI